MHRLVAVVRGSAVLTAAALLGCASHADPSATTAPSSAPATSATTTSAPTAVNTDVVDGDVAVISAALDRLNVAWEAGFAAAVPVLAESIWSPDGTTEDNVLCAYASTAGVDRSLPSEQMLREIDAAGLYERTELTTPVDIDLDPEFVVPAGFIGAGATPEGRVYEVSATLTRGKDVDTQRIHVTVVDDRAYFFVQVC